MNMVKALLKSRELFFVVVYKVRLQIISVPVSYMVSGICKSPESVVNESNFKEESKAESRVSKSAFG